MMLDVWALCLMYLLLIASNHNDNNQLRAIYISSSALFPLKIICFSLSPQKIAWFVCFLNEFVSKQTHSKREKRNVFFTIFRICDDWRWVKKSNLKKIEHFFHHKWPFSAIQVPVYGVYTYHGGTRCIILKLLLKLGQRHIRQSACSEFIDFSIVLPFCHSFNWIWFVECFDTSNAFTIT